MAWWKETSYTDFSCAFSDIKVWLILGLSKRLAVLCKVLHVWEACNAVPGLVSGGHLAIVVRWWSTKAKFWAFPRMSKPGALTHYGLYVRIIQGTLTEHWGLSPLLQTSWVWNSGAGPGPDGALLLFWSFLSRRPLLPASVLLLLCSGWSFCRTDCRLDSKDFKPYH